MDYTTYILSLLSSIWWQVLFFLFNGLVLFLLARRRRMRLSFLAWLPIGQEFTMGAIADDIGGNDRFFGYGRSCYRHILALGRMAAIFIVGIFIYMQVQGLGNLLEALTASALSPANLASDVMSFLLSMVNAYVLYKIFLYYQPERAALFAILSVFFVYLRPFFLLYVWLLDRRRYT